MGQAKYSVPGVHWFRCPGAVTYEQHKAASGSGLLRGCWMFTGLKDVDFQLGGEMSCPHCGGHMDEIGAGEVGELPRGVGAEERPSLAVYVVERVPVASLKKGGVDASLYDWGCCNNKMCSQRYLLPDATDSDAMAMRLEAQPDVDVGRGPVHSATQYMMLKREELSGPMRDSADRWTLSSQTLVRPTGRSWKKCVFCGVGLATSGKDTYLDWPSRPRRMQRRELESEDEQSWRYWGPAATFRLWRWAEWTEKQKEPLVAIEGTK